LTLQCNSRLWRCKLSN